MIKEKPMRDRIVTLLLAFILIFMTGSLLNAQEETGGESEPELNAQEESGFESGAEAFPAKPLDMWEVGVHGGALYFASDLASSWPGGFGVGLHVRRALGYTISLRADLMYGSAQGVDNKSLGSTAGKNPVLSELGYGSNGSEGLDFVRNYRTQMYSGNLQLIVNAGNILFHSPETDWNFYALVGAGLYGYQADYDALDANGDLYDFSSVDFEANDVRDQVKGILDGDFETDAYTTDEVLALNDDNTLLVDIQAGLGVSRKISDRVNISLEHLFTIANTDYLDGFTFRTSADRSNNKDNIHYTNVRINFNIGSFDKRVEPLYWVNPLKTPYSDIAALKQRPELDLTDADNDGILDMFDEDTETPEGVTVDVKGNALDTDNDGVPDYKDEEMFSPQGYDINESGVAQVDDPYLTKSEIEAMVDGKISDDKLNWWLPMINFGLDKYSIEPRMIPALSQIATIVKSNPGLNIVVKGFADNRADEEYNEILSYRRSESAIDYMVERYDLDRDRFIIQYKGEKEPLIRDLPESSVVPPDIEEQHSLNRRVEFMMAGPDDKPMERPEGLEEEENADPEYKGNKNIGY